MKDFTVGKEAKLILQFSVPLVLGNIFQNLYNVADSVIVGRFLGKEALGAVGASFPHYFCFNFNGNWSWLGGLNSHFTIFWST